MIRLNLLPWREERRRERKHQFKRLLGLAVTLGLVIVLAMFAINSGRIALQEAAFFEFAGEPEHGCDGEPSCPRNLAQGELRIFDMEGAKHAEGACGHGFRRGWRGGCGLCHGVPMLRRSGE